MSQTRKKRKKKKNLSVISRRIIECPEVKARVGAAPPLPHSSSSTDNSCPTLLLPCAALSSWHPDSRHQFSEIIPRLLRVLVPPCSASARLVLQAPPLCFLHRMTFHDTAPPASEDCRHALTQSVSNNFTRVGELAIASKLARS